MPISFSEAIASRPVRLFQFGVVALVLLALVFDGMDSQLLGLVAPIEVVDRPETGSGDVGLRHEPALGLLEQCNAVDEAGIDEVPHQCRPHVSRHGASRVCLSGVPFVD